MRTGWLLSALLCLLCFHACLANAAERPNIIVLLCDDLGYGDLSSFAHPKIHSPNLDRLASEGMKLTHYYSASPVCSASRAGLITGRNPNRLGIRDWIGANSRVFLRPGEVTVAQLLKQSGYHTCHVGKWHLNSRVDGSEPTPGDAGFDHWFYTQNNAAPSHVDPVNFVRNGKPAGPLKGASSHLVVDEATQWLDGVGDKPFYLNVWFHESHEPVAATDEFLAQFPDETNRDRRHYFAAVAQMDAAVGKLMKYLDDHGLRDNTFVFFSSDNGPETLNRYSGANRSYGSPGPLRGMKLDVTEAGYRVPGIIRWPGHVKAGTVCTEPVCGVDLLPTACAMIKIEPPRDRALDGASLLPVFEGQPIQRPHPLYWQYDNAMNRPWTISLRDGPWKLLANDAVDKFELYNLADDTGEKRNLAAEQPDRVQAMAAAAKKLRDEIMTEGAKSGNPGTRKPPAVKPAAVQPTDSKPQPVSGSPGKRPNVLVIVADDLGFSDIGCYGGEIETPNLDKLAAGGLRYTQFYNTARCWPTRSALLTGYYPQQIRMDPPEEKIPRWTRVLPQYLKPLGYHCYHSGKWHLFGAPRAVADGGFDRSYKLDDHDRYFHPKGHSKNDKNLPAVKADAGYYATTAIATHAIDCLKEHAEKHSKEPFFEYLAFTSPHFPLHALPEDIAKYRQKNSEGWDVVRQSRWQRLKKMGIVDCSLSAAAPEFTPRYFKRSVLKELGPGEVEHPVAWDSLTAEQKEFQATKMAIHAAMVDRMDQEIGRVLDQVRAMGAMDNTVIFFLSDNGADATVMVRGNRNDRSAAPGSAGSFLCLGPGWAGASNSPFRRHKIWTHEGGISTPLIVHWPEGIAARGELRRDVGHVIDFVPTLLELAGGTPSAEWQGAKAPSLPGQSLAPTFAKDKDASRELFFKHEGNRAFREGNWKLVSAQENGGRWELYDLGTDRCEQQDQAALQPERAREMADKWKQWDARFSRDAKSP